MTFAGANNSSRRSGRSEHRELVLLPSFFDSRTTLGGESIAESAGRIVRATAWSWFRETRELVARLTRTTFSTGNVRCVT